MAAVVSCQLEGLRFLDMCRIGSVRTALQDQDCHESIDRPGRPRPGSSCAKVLELPARTPGWGYPRPDHGIGDRRGRLVVVGKAAGQHPLGRRGIPSLVECAGGFATSPIDQTWDDGSAR